MIDDPVKFGQGLGRIIGTWFGIAAAQGGFLLFEIDRFKRKYRDVIELEKGTLTEPSQEGSELNLAAAGSSTPRPSAIREFL